MEHLIKNRAMFYLVWCFLLGNVFCLFAQEETSVSQIFPTYKMVGDVTQTFQSFGQSWSSGNALWSWQVDLRHELTFGPCAFVADHSLIFPLKSSLISTDIRSVMWEAYIRIDPCERFGLILGQKRLNIGVGHTFTVGDSFNPLVSFLDQKVGSRGVIAQWAPNQWFDWSIGLNAERNLGYDRWDLASLTRTSAGDLNPALLAAASQMQFLIDRWQVAMALVWSPDRTFNPSLGLSYDLWGLILTLEGACEFLPQVMQPQSGQSFAQWTVPSAWSSPIPSGSIGARLSLTPVTDVDLNFSAEYLYWGQGWDQDAVRVWRDVLDSTPLMALSLKSLRSNLPIRGQHNAFFRAGFSGWQTISFDGLLIIDFQDNSFISQLALTYFVFDGLDLIMTWQSCSGEEDSAWNSLPSSGLSNLSGLTWVCGLQARYHF